MKRSSTSFPRHLSDWASILGPKWHFCNSIDLSDIFVNIERQSDVTTSLDLIFGVKALTFFLILQFHFFLALYVVSWRCQPSFDVLALFYHVLCIVDNTHCWILCFLHI